MKEKKTEKFFWGTGLELEFISKLGSIQNPVAPPSYIKACLEGYLRGAPYRDWISSRIDEGRVLDAVKLRLAALK